MHAHDNEFPPATRERRALGLGAVGAARTLDQVPQLRVGDGPGRATVLSLQRTAGNAAVARLLNGGRSPVRGTARRSVLQRDAATDALLDLATPRTGEGQAIGAQKKLIAECEKVVTGLITGGEAADPEKLKYDAAYAQWQKDFKTWEADKNGPYQKWLKESTKWKKDKKGGYQRWLKESTKWKKDKKGPYQQWLKAKEGPEPRYDQGEPRYPQPEPQYPVPIPSRIRGKIYADTPDFLIGGVLLDELPEYQKEKLGKRKATETFTNDLIKNAKLVSPRVAGAMSYKGNPLPEIVEGGFGSLMAENALKTMVDAEQFKYLRAAGLPNKEWKIFVEMHYYRARDKEMAGFHKDTQGQTLFVNLNYHIEDQEQQGLATRGPEYVLNPPPNVKHDAQIYGTVGKKDVPVDQQKAGSLPPKFTSDLAEVRQGLDAPNVIKSAGTIQPYGYVAFVDEAIHHATPFDQGRYVTPTEFKMYLEETYAKEVAEIRSAKQEKRKWNADIIPKRHWKKWERWDAMMLAEDDKQRTTRYNREKLADMTDTEFRRMLAAVGSKQGAERKFGGAGGWYAAAIPGTGAETPLRGKGKPAFRREASLQDVKKNLPAPLPANVSRRFIRTWVRAIPEAAAAQLRQGAKTSAPQVFPDASIRLTEPEPKTRPTGKRPERSKPALSSADNPAIPTFDMPQVHAVVANSELFTFLDTLDPGWNQAAVLRGRDGQGMIVGQGRGVMLGDASKAKDTAPVSGRIRLPGSLRFLKNNGHGALCFVYSIVMGLTGRPQREVEATVDRIVRAARVREGWIASDSDPARRVLVAVEQVFGMPVQVIELQNSASGLIISGRSHNATRTERRPIVIRNTGTHYDAIV
jgi:hypothetical protein